MKHKLSVSLTLALIAAMLVTSLALADNVKNDVVAGGSDTITAGGSTTIYYWIQATGGNGCDASNSSPAIVTISVPGGVTASSSQLTFTACNTSGNEGNPNNTQSITFSSSVAGNYAINASASGYNDSPADFTLYVLAPTDSNPPVITPNVSGTMGNNGWYVSDVTVSWTVVDNESAITSKTGCDPTTINADTAGTTLTCSATSAGGTSSQSVTIKRDATPPAVSASASPAANANGWNNSNVTVSFSGSDNLSGIASCDTPVVLSSEGAGQSATGSCTDLAGNSASATASGINIDKTAPAVTVTGVADGAQYVLGSVPAAGCSTSDALSGVATEASLSMSGGPVVGFFTATCSGALDYAGNPGSASATFQVIYAWTGFFQPIDNGIWNTAKAGSAIPVKFSLGGNQGLSIFDSGYPKFVKVSCTSGTEDVIESTVTAGGSSLTYDTLAGQYIYVWKTEKSWAGLCGRLDVKLIDGTVHSANFKFK